MKRHLVAWGIPLLGALVALLIFYASFSSPFFGHTDLEKLQEHMWQAIAAFAALAVFLGVLIVQILVTLEVRSIEVTRLLAKIERSKSFPVLEPMGTAAGIVSTHYKDLILAAQSASIVKNTLVFSNLPSDEIENYLSKSNVERRFAVLDKTLSNDGVWHDLISENTQNAEKCRNFVEAIQKTKDKWSVNYRPLLTKAVPTVNMVLFDKREVWFGFGLFSSDAHPVFRTTDSSVIDYFDRYWDVLAEDAAPWSALWRNDIEGAWISVACDAAGTLTDCAVIRIELSGTELKVFGHVFGFANGKFEAKSRSFESDSSFFSIRPGANVASFDFMFTRQSGTQYIKGGASYKFAFDSQSATVPRSFEGSAFTAEGHNRDVFGRRLNTVWSGRAISGGVSGALELVRAMSADNAFVPNNVTADAPFAQKAPTLNKYLA
ncbi:hypothetical protein [Paraburkholderia sp. DHOC27]|uniref:hypothetical protein n=1 Tax=Paraburkholderia sp. DHOC27 TaxID=2303330 RepID=UPI000E3E6C62|nr:hypothetical protein [Paraburkholderia sp. DHOC27]RFU45447.1 hypothetical protein D0B32_22815 [Paraburkholderia sp. DHOC27]